ncbi:MAG: DMT family transporter, partial [Rhodospirillales bacterium]|nr:DMT family transporter [Rhodospirillales bacterium]
MEQERDPSAAEVPAGPASWPTAPCAAVPAGAARQNTLVLFAWLLVMGVVWGATFSLAKIATSGGAHPLGLTLWQGLFGGLFLLGVSALRRRRLPLDRPHAAFYLVCGVLGTVLPGTLFFYAAPHVPAGILAITVAIVPILTYAVTMVIRIDALSPRRVFGILLGLAAVILLVGPESSLPRRDMVPWVLVSVLASAF